jgi:hypothetical protein
VTDFLEIDSGKTVRRWTGESLFSPAPPQPTTQNGELVTNRDLRDIEILEIIQERHDEIKNHWHRHFRGKSPEGLAAGLLVMG